jgi:hypothetical protein
MVSEYSRHLDQRVSSARLSSYGNSDDDVLDVAATYIWNASISQSLYLPLSMLEITIRNRIHHVMSEHVGTEYWFLAVLHVEEMRTVHEVWSLLSKKHRTPPTAGKVLADLTLGFWPKMFEKKYHEMWWKNHTELFRNVFPFVPKGSVPSQAVTPSLVHDHLESFRILRNRVMHHEPVFGGITSSNGTRMSIDAVHANVLAMIDWMDPRHVTSLRSWIRFPRCSCMARNAQG